MSPPTERRRSHLPDPISTPAPVPAHVFSPGVCALQAQGPPSAPSAPGFPSFPQFLHVGRRSRAETIRTLWSVPNCRPWLPGRIPSNTSLMDGNRLLISSPGNDGNRKPPNRLDWDAEQVETSPWDLQGRFSSCPPLNGVRVCRCPIVMSAIDATYPTSCIPPCLYTITATAVSKW